MKILKTVDALKSEGNFDYATKNPDKGLTITHQDELKKIQKSQAEKLKKAS